MEFATNARLLAMHVAPCLPGPATDHYVVLSIANEDGPGCVLHIAALRKLRKESGEARYVVSIILRRLLLRCLVHAAQNSQVCSDAHGCLVSPPGGVCHSVHGGQ